MYTVRDFTIALSRDLRGDPKTNPLFGTTVFNLIQDKIDSSDLSNRLTTLKIELRDIPEYKAYLENHDARIEKYGRKPDDKDTGANRTAVSIIDDRCDPEKLELFNKEEAEELSSPVDRKIKQIPLSITLTQKVKGSYWEMLYPFIDQKS